MHGTFEIPELLILVAIALAIGGLIGLERERRQSRKYAGLRTMALFCAAGPITVSLGESADSGILLAVVLASYLGLAVAMAVGVVYIRLILQGENIGLTTSVTVFLVALLGILVGYDRLVEASAITITTVLLLAERDRLHEYVSSLTDQELRDSLKLGALVFVLFPILPAEPIDPYDVVVLREVLLFVIFVLLIEFVSYVLMRQLGGSTGLAVTGLLAGGANSFATAGVLARMPGQSEAALDASSFALLLATTSMILRNVGIAVALAIPLLWLVWQPAVAMVALTLAVAGAVWYTGEMHEEFDIDLDSPFSFRAAAKFAIAYIAILVISVGAEATIGETGLYASAFAGGLISSAAVSVTAATVFNEGTVGVTAAVGMVVLGIAASLTSKILLVEWIESDMRTKATIPMAFVGLLGLAVYLLSLL